MSSKYEGISKPASEVNKAGTVIKNEPPKKHSYLKGLFYRTVIAGVILGLIFGFVSIDSNFTNTIREGLQTAITTDFVNSPSVIEREYFLWDSFQSVRE